MDEGNVTRPIIDQKTLEEAVQNALKSYLRSPEPATNPRTQFYNKFQHEADVHDKHFVEKYDADLDTTLIFAGLLSAVTSAFVIAIQAQLQPDYTQLSYDIAWAFANSAGLPNIGVPPKSDSPWKGPDPILVHAQAILLSSLAASLLAAFVAILGKQWLNRYSRVDTRESVIARSRDRQRKIDGVTNWGFHLVMESLPLMLQAALLLLGCALSKYLFTINDLIAWVVVGFTASGFLFYLLIIFAAFVSYDCPFQTPLPLIVRFLIKLDHKRNIKRCRWWLRHMFSRMKRLLRPKPWRPSGWGRFGPLNTNSVDNHLEIPMASPHDHPFALFGEDTNWEGYVLDSNCIAWMFEKSTDPDVFLNIMEFIPEIIWHAGIGTTPLEKLYETVLACFDNSTGSPVLIRKSRNEAYLSAKALLHVAIQRECMATESDKELLNSISRKHRAIGTADYKDDHDLKSTLQMVDRIFGNDSPESIRWREFSFTDSHHTWMSRMLLYRASAAVRQGEPLPDDIGELIFDSPRAKHPPPPIIVTGCLCLIGQSLGILPPPDDQQAADKSHRFLPQINKIYDKLTGMFQGPELTNADMNRALGAMKLIASLSEDIATRSYDLFHLVLHSRSTRVHTEEMWEAARYALRGAYAWSNALPHVGNPEDILAFLSHHFDMAIQRNENHDIPIYNALCALAYAPGSATITIPEDFDPAQPSFIRGICYVFQQRELPQLRKAALIFLPHIADKWFKTANPIMSSDQMSRFCVDWSSAVDEIGDSDGGWEGVLEVLLNMIDSRHWRPHIDPDKWELLDRFSSALDDFESFRRCLDNPQVVDDVLSVENRDAKLLWLTILLLRYRGLNDQVHERLVTAVRSIRGKDLDAYLLAVDSEMKKAESELTQFTTWSNDSQALALRERIGSHKEAKKLLETRGGVRR